MNEPREPRAFSRNDDQATQEAPAQKQTPGQPSVESRPTDVWRKAPVLSCVIPCRNEARNLDLLLPQLCELLPTISRAWEIVLVDDGSTDNTRGRHGRLVRRCRAFASCSCRAISARTPR